MTTARPSSKPNEKSVMIWAHRLLRTHGEQADAWALKVSEQHRLSKDGYGAAKWETIARRIAELRARRKPRAQ
jgi:hypothetical protein